MGSGRSRAPLELKRRLGERFAFFVNLDWKGIDEPDWGAREAAQLSEAARLGARGVEDLQDLGLGVRTATEGLPPVRRSPAGADLREAGALGLVVAIDTGDPRTFFEPVTPRTSATSTPARAVMELRHRDYPRARRAAPPRDRVLARHPRTTFLGIHLGNKPRISTTWTACFHHPTSTSTPRRASASSAGWAPTGAGLLHPAPDRILFGSDIVISPGALQLGSLSSGPTPTRTPASLPGAPGIRDRPSADRSPDPIQGAWKIDAIDLPPEVLQKIYVDNALNLISAEGGLTALLRPLETVLNCPYLLASCAPHKETRHGKEDAGHTGGAAARNGCRSRGEPAQQALASWSRCSPPEQDRGASAPRPPAPPRISPGRRWRASSGGPRQAQRAVIATDEVFRQDSVPSSPEQPQGGGPGSQDARGPGGPVPRVFKVDDRFELNLLLVDAEQKTLLGSDLPAPGVISTKRDTPAAARSASPSACARRSVASRSARSCSR